MFEEATISDVATRVLGRPTIRNFESVKRRITDKVEGVNTEIKTSISSTRTAIVTFPETIKAGVEMKVEDTLSQVKQEVADTQQKIVDAPMTLANGAKRAISDAAFDIKEAASRATEEAINDLQSLQPARLIISKRVPPKRLMTS